MAKIKMTPSQFSAFSAQMAAAGKTIPMPQGQPAARASGLAPTKGQKVTTYYQPTGPSNAYNVAPEVRHEQERAKRRVARHEQKPSLKNSARKIGRSISSAIGAGNRSFQTGARNFIASQDKEISHIRRDVRNTDTRIREKIAPRIDMSSSWVMSPTPSQGWLTGSRGPWSTSSLPSVANVFGVSTSLPLMEPSTKKKKSTKKKSRK
jgi:hypothetical protein